MATRYQFGDSTIPHFITFAVVNWIDALSRPIYKQIIIDSLTYCIHNKGLKVHGWVIMSNHVHFIISAAEANELTDIVRDFKKFTSKQLLKEITENVSESRSAWMLWMFERAGKANSNNTTYQFWQQDNHPIILTNDEMALQKLNYIHENPVKEGLVTESWHYNYSSAVDYCTDKKGLLPIVALY